MKNGDDIGRQPEAGTVPAPPFSLRLTAEERAQLETLAGRMSLGAYIRAKVFDRPHPRKKNVRRPLPGDKALLQVLAELGRTQAYNNLNQIAKKANAGALPMTPETEAALLEACRNIQKIRRDIVHHLRKGH